MVCRCPARKHAAQPIAPVPHVDDTMGVVAPALRGFTVDFQQAVTALSAAGLRDGLEEVGLESQSRPGEQPNGERRLPASDHLQPAHSPATPTAPPQRQPLDVLAAVGSHEGAVQPRRLPGVLPQGDRPARNAPGHEHHSGQTSITRRPAATALATAVATGAETPQRNVAPRAPRRAWAPPMIVPVASAAPPAAAPAKLCRLTR